MKLRFRKENDSLKNSKEILIFKHATMKTFRFMHLILLFVWSENVQAQDIHFSQYFMNNISINPALTGGIHDMQINANYKDQWRSLSNPFKTFSFGFDKALKLGYSPNRLGIGGFLYNDQVGAGFMTTTSGMANIAYHVKLDSKNKIGGGMALGFKQDTYGLSGIQTGNQYNGMQYDNGINTGEYFSSTNHLILDAGLGILYVYKESAGNTVVASDDKCVTIGLSLSHLNKPKTSLYNLEDRNFIRTTFHGNARIPIQGTNTSINPSFITNFQGPFNEIIVGAMYRVLMSQASKITSFRNSAAFSMGVHYRHKDAVILASVYEYSNFQFGFSYDINVSSLNTFSKGRGGFELTLKYVTPGMARGSRSRI
jgi:type IX secretion system PorP/SprF family membrane protein